MPSENGNKASISSAAVNNIAERESDMAVCLMQIGPLNTDLDDYSSIDSFLSSTYDIEESLDMRFMQFGSASGSCSCLDNSMNKSCNPFIHAQHSIATTAPHDVTKGQSFYLWVQRKHDLELYLRATHDVDVTILRIVAVENNLLRCPGLQSINSG